MVAITFNARDVDPSTGGQDIFENGEYGFQIVKSEAKPTKKKDGTILSLELACTDEGMVGRRTIVNLNVQNPSAQAMEIAYRDLSAICHVTGVLDMTDTQQLHGRPFRARMEKTTYTKNDGSEGHGNEIKAYLDVNGEPPKKGVPAGAAAGGVAAPTAPTAPAAPTQPAAPVQPTAPAQPEAPAQPTAPAAPAAPAEAPAQPAAPWNQAPAAGAPAAPAAGAIPPWQQQG